jgi:2'-5' RNA ligase
MSGFPLSLATLGVFPGPLAPRVVWIGLGGDVASLGQLRRNVESAVSPLGYPPDRRGFSPHLTLARVNDFVSPSTRSVLGRIVQESPPPAALRFDVAEVALMRSELTRDGAIYSRVLSLPLH